MMKIIAHLDGEEFEILTRDFVAVEGEVVYLDAEPLIIEDVRYEMNRVGDNADISVHLYLKHKNG